MSAVVGMSGRKCGIGCQCGRHSRAPFTSEHCANIGKSKLGLKRAPHKLGCTCAFCGQDHAVVCIKGCVCLRHANSGKYIGSRARLCTEDCKCNRHENSGNLNPVAKWKPGQEPWNKGRTDVYSQAALEKMSMAAVARIATGVYNITPNGLETSILKLLPSGWRYVGDGTLIVGTKCPDFWDGGTRLIEAYGDYWHRGQDPQDRIDYFAERGYECMVIWEQEVRGNRLDKLLEFAA